MRQFICVSICCLIIVPLFSCNKELATPRGAGSDPYGSGAPGDSPQGTSGPTSTVSLMVNGSPVTVTGVSFDRSGTTTGTFDFSVWNALQRIDVYCFSLLGQSGFNAQFDDSINYSTRPDSQSAWTTVSAVKPGTVNFDCCAAPLIDTVVLGQYSGNFSSGTPGLSKDQGDQTTLTVNGKFDLLFSGANSCH